MVVKRIIPLLFFFILTGCLKTNHIEVLAIVTATVNDLMEEEKLEETFVFFDFEEKKAEPKMVTGYGTTIIGASQDAQLKVKFQVKPDKMKVKLYGSEVAKQGLSPYIDILSRDPKFTDNVSIALSETTAKEILEAQEKSIIKINIGQQLYELINKN